jgi:hypothetical protein
MDFQDYSPETQVAWTALEVGKEYIHCMAGGGGSDFKKFVFARIERIAECIFVIPDEPAGHAFAVGDWIEMAGGPLNRFWTSDTPIPPPPPVSEETNRNASPLRCSREQPSIQ